jgi:defect-in-organelle-trafficking protein DotB
VFEPNERTERSYAMMETLRMVVTQTLVPRVGGGRVGLREFLVFDDRVREIMLNLPLEKWTAEAQRLLRRYGQPMEETARNVFKQGLIDRRTYLFLTQGFSADDHPDADEFSSGPDVLEGIESGEPSAPSPALTTEP